MPSVLKRIAKVMKEQGNSKKQIEMFNQLYTKLIEQKDFPIEWNKISSPAPEMIVNQADLEEANFQQSQKLLSELVVCKLNGGLGSSMGCVGPKSAIEVREGKTFLDLIVDQIRNINEMFFVDVPVLLMNSFNTHDDTEKIIKKHEESLNIHTFKQNEFPRLKKENLLPLSKNEFDGNASYPPGHGDFFTSFFESKYLDQLIRKGKKFAFVSNADNLGATVDMKILHHINRNNIPFVMEVTPKTRADIKGGTVIKQGENGLRLLEIAQVPQEYQEEFKSVKKFNVFNTNNIWINLKVLKEKLTNGGLDLDIIVNEQKVDKIPVIQLETAIGGGIHNFEGGIAVNVDRSRFLPVKKTGDLLLVQSNLFNLKKGTLVRNPERQFVGLPLVQLGEFFRTVEDYHTRIPRILDILELDLLTIVGDIRFDRKVTLRGNVILVCEQGELHVPRGAVLENKVLTGSTKMGDL